MRTVFFFFFFELYKIKMWSEIEINLPKKKKEINSDRNRKLVIIKKGTKGKERGKEIPKEPP